MARFRSIAPPASHACGCGGVMQPARRFEATRTVNVQICWRCGTEDPPFRTPATRPLVGWCRYCGEKFAPTDPRQRYCPDRDCADRAGRITLDRNRLGGQLSRRPA